ncbi:OmpH family outer membrane protein [Dictyoglomus thermophilum]|uniref:Outer membrane protein OmpH n=2 Tax=Dictyoglomus thermophilum TaxID=14 RepID=B5YDC5_DICT6|nr:OmpH family outer membrane protein [Dictyoglomus thermophilum]ACI18485.1 outer membrane protein OmpH [Dictyoglomus thermophilum H-6-12]MCX7721339.1 OmpH family outer membrane protein [Dictyoglomus thermophilum]TYT22930.1 OmpH family outer membrane protein [Dictyoglomus thermophilum]
MRRGKLFPILFLSLIFTFSVISSTQTLNVGVLDYSKVFMEYKETKTVQNEIKKRQEAIEKLIENYKKKGMSEKEINEYRVKEEKKLGDFVEEARQRIRTKIYKEVEKVAKSKKLSVVLERKVRIWGGIDITTEVLNNLNK